MSDALFGRLKARLAGRPDSEHEMSVNRLVFAIIIVIFIVAFGKYATSNALLGMALFIALALGVLAHIVAVPRVCPERRLCALLLDGGFLGWQLHMGGETVAAFFPVYLWVIFGNGFRFGLNWLRIAMAVCTVSFVAVILTTEFWQRNEHLAAGLSAGLIVLPLYAGTLIRRLSEARRLAEEASQAKTLFLASVSHELRTPLTAIIGMGGLLHASPLTREQREMTQTVQDAARSLLRLIDSILDLSRIEAGRLPRENTEFDVLDLLAEIRGLVIAQAKAKGVMVAVHVTGRTPPLLRGSRNHLHEILLNLAGNAVKFTTEGGVLLRVDATEARDGRTRLLVEVEDTGIGIPSEAHARIFEDFTQADATILNRFGGTGLGLSIAKRLAASLGGELGVRSEVGRGTTFYLTLECDTADQPDPPALPVLTAVMLDDGGAEADMVASAIAAAGPEVVRAGGAESALYLVKTGMPGTTRNRTLLVVVGLALRDDLERLCNASPLAGPAGNVPGIFVGDGRDMAAIRWQFATTLSPGAPARDVTRALGIAAASGGRASSAPAYLPAPASRPLRVLVADDNRVNQQVLSKILEQAGHAARIVSDGEAALDALEDAADDFDIVLMDVNMPVMGGLEATKLFRFMALGRPHLPIVGLTADATEAMAKRCAQAGMDACVSKPVEPAALLQLVSSLARVADPPPSRTSATMPAAVSPAERATGSAVVLDDQTLENLHSLGGAEFVSALIGDFIEEADAIVRRLVNAARAGDIVSFHAQRHALRSTAANMGARALLDASESIVVTDAKGLKDRVPDIAQRLSHELERTRRALVARRGTAAELPGGQGGERFGELGSGDHPGPGLLPGGAHAGEGVGSPALRVVR